MGFGRDQVKGSYKVVRLLFDFNNFEILDLHIGEWRKLSPPPYRIEATTIGKSACVNGSIYWLNLKHAYKILALDLHTQVFRDVPVLPPPLYSNAAQIVNLEDRLAIVDTREWVLEIWIMDAQGKRWTMTYSISLSRFPSSPDSWKWWFRPIAVSKKGSLFLYGNENKLFEYHPETDFLRCLSPHICVIAPFIENLVSLGSCVPKISTSGHRYGLSYLQPACVPKISTSGHPSLISSVVGRIESLIPNILLTSALVSLIMFGYMNIARCSKKKK